MPVPIEFRPRKCVTGVERERSVAPASAVVECRQASAPDSGRVGASRSSVARRRARWHGVHETLRLPAFRFLIFLASGELGMANRELAPR